MTIQDVLNTVNVMYPNTYDNDDKIKMISTLDMLTNEEVFRQYIDGDYIEDFKGYNDKPLTTELLIKEPYAEDVYRYYVQAQIALNNRETTDYSNAMAMFNNAYQSYKIMYNKEHEHTQPNVNWW